jgi:AcrR family transcriptional regulator
MERTATAPERPSLRERKKRMTRQAILDAAERLFAERGYEKVTVAQIADAANIAVKTLFTYFDSKEDLVFGGEDEMRDAILAAVGTRPAGTSPLEAMRSFLKDLAAQDESASGVETFHAAYGSVPQLHSRMLVMFEHFEEALAAQLAAEAGSAGNPSADPAPRLAAAQLVSLLRLITSEQARAYLASRAEAERGRALREWIDRSADLLAGGLADYAVSAAGAAGAADPGTD